MATVITSNKNRSCHNLQYIPIKHKKKTHNWVSNQLYGEILQLPGSCNAKPNQVIQNTVLKCYTISNWHSMVLWCQEGPLMPCHGLMVPGGSYGAMPWCYSARRIL